MTIVSNYELLYSPPVVHYLILILNAIPWNTASIYQQLISPRLMWALIITPPVDSLSPNDYLWLQEHDPKMPASGKRFCYRSTADLPL